MVLDVSLVDSLRLVRWADASVDQLVADYDAVKLTVTEDNGRTAQLVIPNHIGCRWDGHWDENIVGNAELMESSEWLTATLKNVSRRYGDQPEPGGGVRRLDLPWFNLIVTFIDGATISVLGHKLEVSFGHP